MAEGMQKMESKRVGATARINLYVHSKAVKTQLV